MSIYKTAIIDSEEILVYNSITSQYQLSEVKKEKKLVVCQH